MSEGRHRPPARKPSQSPDRSAARKRRLPIAALLAPVVLVVAVASLIFVVGHGKVSGIFTGGGQDETTPAFDFRIGKTHTVSTSEKTDPKDLRSAAKGATTDAAPLIDTLYTEAFLNPSNWRDGTYDSALEVFDDPARQSALGQLDTVTLGAAAGETFDGVDPDKGKLSFKVLFDANGKPTTVVAIVEFQALAKGKDGTYTEIVSHGQYFLRESGCWKIFSFSVRRADHETRPPPAPSGTPSASAS